MKLATHILIAIAGCTLITFASNPMETLVGSGLVGYLAGRAAQV